jgi:hypothetical protein
VLEVVEVALAGASAGGLTFAAAVGTLTCFSGDGSFGVIAAAFAIA